ncbi:hypothetical protein DF034_05510 [Burkholderia anthina]|nr:hypothetical protein DF034_05510 [Burkholderia anthina]
MLSGLENTHARRHGDAAWFISRAVHPARTSGTSTACAQSFFPHPQPEKTTVATCGTTVVIRDAALTLWA